MSNAVVITSAARTAVGSLGKSLKNTPSDDLGSSVILNSLKRSRIKNEDVDAEPLPVTQFSQRQDNYDVSRARQMLDTLDEKLKAESSAKSGPVPQLEYTPPLLIKNESEMRDAIDTRPPSPVEVDMRAEVGRQLESPDDSDRPMKQQVVPLNNP